MCRSHNGYLLDTNTTAPVLVGTTLGVVELGAFDGIDDGAILGAAVTKFTQKIKKSTLTNSKVPLTSEL